MTEATDASEQRLPIAGTEADAESRDGDSGAQPAAAEPERRLHSASWLFVTLRHVRQFMIPLLVLVVFDSGGFGGTSGGTQGGDALARGEARDQLWSVFALCLLAVYSIWQYYTYRFHIGEDSLLIRSGVFARSLRQIPFARIQNVALHQSLLHRAFKVAEVRLESAGGIEPEAEMRVLALADATALEALVRRSRGRAGATPAAVRTDAQAGDDAVDVDTLIALPTREVVRLGLISNRGMLLIAGVLAVLSQLSPALIETILRTWVRAMSGYVTSYGRGYEVMALLSLIAMMVAALRLFTIGLALLQYHGFRLELHGRRLMMQRGLLSRLRTSVPHRRIQTFTLHETLLHRLLRRRTLEVSTAVLDNGSHSQPRSLRELAPVATPAHCDALIARLLPGAQWPPPRWHRLHRLAWLRLLWPQVLVVTLLCAMRLLPGGPDYLLLPALWLPWALLSSWMRARRAGYAVDAVAIAVREGWWTRRWRVAGIDKVQGLQLVRNPLDRLFGTASLLLDTAGGMGPGAPLRLRLLPLADAQALEARLSRAVARSPLRW
jgi:putative membrane protein